MTSGLSERGRDIVANPPAAEYIRAHLDRSGDDPFHPEHNPNGYIALCVAENKLTSDLLLDGMASVPAPTATHLGYDAMIGNLRFREAVAGLLGTRLARRPIAADHLAAMAGAGAVLESLFYAICDPGDAVLIPTPAYATFWADLGTRDAVRIVEVPCRSEDGFRLTVDLLDEAMERSEHPVKALLVTSPHNPLGTVASRDEIEAIVAWCEARRIHLVMDEIYALSTYGDAEFTSVAQVRPVLGDFIHIVWAFSKDFGVSGFRAGFLWSENEGVLAAVDGLAYWSAVSSHTQHVLTELVNDAAWVDGYLREQQQRLRAAHDSATAALDSIGVGHIAAEAGIFVFCDFRRYLPEPTWEREAELWRRILDETAVNLTPGSACHSPEPGWMRLCFAAQPMDLVAEAVERIGRLLRG